MKKAVIFDLDGTLLDTLDDLADSMNCVMDKFGYPQHPRDAYKFFVGDGMEMLSRRSLPEEKRDQASVARCWAAMREEYGRRWADKTKPYAGIPELLTELSRKKVSIGIYTNKPHDFALKVVETLLPHWRFVGVIGQRPGGPKKPDPAGALEIARLVGVSSDDCLYVGDSNTDMHTATAAGMFAIGVLWGFRGRDELRESGANALIGCPEELLGYL
jgi:phosphoglycolate phosphatase